MTPVMTPNEVNDRFAALEAQVQKSDRQLSRTRRQMRVTWAVSALAALVTLTIGWHKDAIAQGYGMTLAQAATRIAALETKTASMTATVDPNTGIDTVRFTGVNVQVVNGTTSTNRTNGAGNLIVGYNESRNYSQPRYGSHNLIVGRYNAYASFGGAVIGNGNTIYGAEASVFGGVNNTAGSANDSTSGKYSTVSGGSNNTASGESSSVTGGYQNKATLYYSSVTGGNNNTASAYYSSVSGGSDNEASGMYSSVSGGQTNKALWDYTSVSGGYNNIAGGYSSYGRWASVSGGKYNDASGEYSTVSSGAYNRTIGSCALVSGGEFNRAEGYVSSVSGGQYVRQLNDYGFSAGGQYPLRNPGDGVYHTP